MEGVGSAATARLGAFVGVLNCVWRFGDLRVVIHGRRNLYSNKTSETSADRLGQSETNADRPGGVVKAAAWVRWGPLVSAGGAERRAGMLFFLLVGVWL